MTSKNNTSAKTKVAKPTLAVRNARVRDVGKIRQLTKVVYPSEPPYSADMIKGHIANYPEGQFVAVLNDEKGEHIVGYCATCRVMEEVALEDHSWDEITGGGFGSRHEENGNILYGMEVCVDPNYRGLRIGNRLYRARKELCQYARLKGIIFGGRISGYRRRRNRVSSPEEYIEKVSAKEIRDASLTFQLRNGFEVLKVIRGYDPTDRDSMGCCALMRWDNPEISSDAVSRKDSPRSSRIVRVASVQYKQRRVKSFDEFAKHVEYFVDVVASYQSDFVVFPELFTLQLLSIENRHISPSEAIATLTQYTEPFKEFMSRLAVKYNVNIIGGSHPSVLETGESSKEIQNICYVFLRDGTTHQQVKIHPTPDEKYWWNIKGGSQLSSIETDCGMIGILICYDSEFPELARHLINQGVRMLFIPFCTDERQSYLRVRYCAQARAVENQCYVVLSGNVGNLPGVENMDIQYAQSCILTPCDFPFARDGIAADTTPNAETVIFADLRIDDLERARNSGTVQNLKNRRHDLYSVRWKSRR